MPDTPTPSQQDIAELEDQADALEGRAEDDIPEDGIGPQTGVAP